jgi:hypothetical protein
MKLFNKLRRGNALVESLANDLSLKIVSLAAISAQQVSKKYEGEDTNDVGRKYLKLVFESVYFFHHITCRLAPEVLDKHTCSQFTDSFNEQLGKVLFENEILNALGTDWKERLRGQFQDDLNRADEYYSRYEIDLNGIKDVERSVIFGFATKFSEILERPEDWNWKKLGVDIATTSLDQLSIFKLLSCLR